jgi:trans-aconitate 2-methyltransferase
MRRRSCLRAKLLIASQIGMRASVRIQCSAKSSRLALLGRPYAFRMAREWDAATYDAIADPMTRWGSSVLERLPLVGDETVLDAGCGSGRVTELLAGRLPRGRVVALDASTSMIRLARRHLSATGQWIDFVVADLATTLPFRASLDTVFSTATFHWVVDHDRLFRNIAAVLRPGGRLVAQCGGQGNIESVVRAVTDLGYPWPTRTTFATQAETRARLETSGFVDVECWLHDEPTALGNGEAAETYLRTVCLRSILEELPASESDRFVRAVSQRLAGQELDYVRLNIDARRAL